MNSFSISDLQQFTGIKAHTIRIWEKRYNALEPFRSEGNTRYYSGEQLRRLLTIVSLMDKEHKISYLCTLSDKELNKLLDEKLDGIIKSYSHDDILILQMVSAALDFNEAKFDKLFSNALLRYGMKDTYRQIIYPTLVRLGIMWNKDDISVAQEHFVINLIKQKLSTSIEALIPNPESKYTWLLYLPEDEFHEVGLMMANYLIRQAGHKVIYLGSNVPFDAVQSAVNLISPDMILFFLVGKRDALHNQDYCALVSHSFLSRRIYVAVEENCVKDLKRSSNNLNYISSVEALLKVIEEYS